MRNTKIFKFITIHTKTLVDAKLLCRRFNKIEGFIRVYDGTRHLLLFGSEK